MNKRNVETAKTVLEIVLEVCKAVKDLLDKKGQK